MLTYLSLISAANISLWSSASTQVKYELLTVRVNEIVSGLVFGCRVDFRASTENLIFPVPGFKIILKIPLATMTGSVEQQSTFLKGPPLLNLFPIIYPAIGLKYSKIIGSLIFDKSFPLVLDL